MFLLNFKEKLRVKPSNNIKIGENNMLKRKLLASTAAVLATSIATASLAEVKVSGYQEWNYITHSDDTNSVSNSTVKQVGNLTGITFSGGGDLDNGMSYSAKIVMENGDQAGRGVGINLSDSVKLSIENDGSVGIEGAAKALLPYVNNRRQDIAGFSRTASTSSPLGNDIGDNTSGDNAIGLTMSSDMGNFMASYTPNPDSTGSTDDLDGASTDSGSSMSIGFKGSLGVEGLTVGLGAYEQSASDTSLEDGSSQSFGFNYKIGAATIGAQNAESKMVGDAVGAQEEQSWNEVGVAFAAADNLTVGVYYAEIEYKPTSGASVDSEVTTFQAGYNLGPAVVQYDFVQADNAYSTANRDIELHKLKLKVNF